MGKQKFPDAEKRLFSRVFVCMKCGAKIKTDISKIRSGKAKCRKCRTKQLRAIHKERKV